MMQEAVLDFRSECSFWEMALYAGVVHRGGRLGTSGESGDGDPCPASGVLGSVYMYQGLLVTLYNLA